MPTPITKPKDGVAANGVSPREPLGMIAEAINSLGLNITDCADPERHMDGVTGRPMGGLDRLGRDVKYAGLNIAGALDRLGLNNPEATFGAIEAFGYRVVEAAGIIAGNICKVADSINNLADAIRETK